MIKKYRVLICGTTHGQVYLSMFMTKNPHFRLAGILAKGSRRSKNYAKEFGVPLFGSVDEVPDDIDIACVVVRSTIAKGEGTFIAKEFLKHGVHVIQEHPIHAGDVASCLDLAKANGVCYHVNSHYVHLEPVRTFIDYAVSANRHREPLFIEATASLQTLYSLIDIVGHSVGGFNPFVVSRPVEWSEGMKAASRLDFVPFTCLQAVIRGVPMTLKIQNFHDPSAFDNHFLIMHRISVGTDVGNLTLVNTHGPVVWSQGFSISEEDDQERPFQKRKTSFSRYTIPTAVSFTKAEASSLSGISRREWPEGILRALTDMKQNIETGVSPFGQKREYLLELSELWLEITRRIGRAHTMNLSPAPPPDPDPLTYAQGLNRVL